ncbi:MAG: hypothetical protein GY699_22400 [Desulfobacteraceae bacterium]|nr:hypothetical protein [Desulfobacteraceae bacterium]
MIQFFSYDGFTLGAGLGVGYTASSATISTTSALYQYNKGSHSVDNTGNDSIWSSSTNK